MTYLDTLRKLAQAATPGWGDVTDFMLEQGVHQSDVAYIAACSPERILQLLAVIEAAKAWRDSEMVEDDQQLESDLVAAIDALAALEGDK